ncbi:uncharacterized protein LOC131615781 [Vicia villosa]|uniref:uncharacterized protein LOC131615781 n=1 Tax=Vicia villosa TaxID=3911 RepID=UPI00273B8C55|nr:uncharacterized protein LOC131615781 [Vicia villosa]
MALLDEQPTGNPTAVNEAAVNEAAEPGRKMMRASYILGSISCCMFVASAKGRLLISDADFLLALVSYVCFFNTICFCSITRAEHYYPLEIKQSRSRTISIISFASKIFFFAACGSLGIVCYHLVLATFT